MKKLLVINLYNLKVLEFGQFIKSSINNTQALGTITDANTNLLLAALLAKSGEYDLAMMHIAKSAETIKIENADIARDRAVTTFERQLSVYEYSETTTELDAYASLIIVMNVYKNMQKMNYEEESNAIDNFIIEMNKPANSPHIFTLGLDSFLTRIETKNTEFKTVFAGRTLETAAKPNYDVKALRTEIRNLYQGFANYILAIANLQPTSQSNDILNVLNAVRKYYHDLLAIREGKKGEDETPIPPMPEA